MTALINTKRCLMLIICCFIYGVICDAKNDILKISGFSNDFLEHDATESTESVKAYIYYYYDGEELQLVCKASKPGLVKWSGSMFNKYLINTYPKEYVQSQTTLSLKLVPRNNDLKLNCDYVSYTEDTQKSCRNHIEKIEFSFKVEFRHGRVADVFRIDFGKFDDYLSYDQTRNFVYLFTTEKIILTCKKPASDIRGHVTWTGYGIDGGSTTNSTINLSLSPLRSHRQSVTCTYNDGHTSRNIKTQFISKNLESDTQNSGYDGFNQTCLKLKTDAIYKYSYDYYYDSGEKLNLTCKNEHKYSTSAATKWEYAASKKSLLNFASDELIGLQLSQQHDNMFLTCNIYCAKCDDSTSLYKNYEFRFVYRPRIPLTTSTSTARTTAQATTTTTTRKSTTTQKPTTTHKTTTTTQKPAPPLEPAPTQKHVSTQKSAPIPITTTTAKVSTIAPMSTKLPHPGAVTKPVTNNEIKPVTPAVTKSEEPENTDTAPPTALQPASEATTTRPVSNELSTEKSSKVWVYVVATVVTLFAVMSAAFWYRCIYSKRKKGQHVKSNVSYENLCGARQFPPNLANNYQLDGDTLMQIDEISPYAVGNYAQDINLYSNIGNKKEPNIDELYAKPIKKLKDNIYLNVSKNKQEDTNISAQTSLKKVKSDVNNKSNTQTLPKEITYASIDTNSHKQTVPSEITYAVVDTNSNTKELPTDAMYATIDQSDTVETEGDQTYYSEVPTNYANLNGKRHNDSYANVSNTEYVEPAYCTLRNGK